MANTRFVRGAAALAAWAALAASVGCGTFASLSPGSRTVDEPCGSVASCMDGLVCSNSNPPRCRLPPGACLAGTDCPDDETCRAEPGKKVGMCVRAAP